MRCSHCCKNDKERNVDVNFALETAERDVGKTVLQHRLTCEAMWGHRT